ncbi:zinc finger MYM-type protein 1-like [Oratosquilla oratoria]|uniref:zinc finger MYM-type protein 1-like n=1 Tax=Oratosquilla oratoria TaxID=337810 RepID=UPI003F7755DD
MSSLMKLEAKLIKLRLLQADETTDCAMHAQLSIIIRYVYEDKICERFLGFYEISDDKSTTRLADVIATVLNSFHDATDKLVSQTYDGAAVMAGTLNGVQSKLRDKGFKHAHFIHCYAHKLNLVLSKSAEKVSGVKMFFSHLRSFSKFTSSSTKRKSIFRQFSVSIPSLCETRWCYRSRTVSSIKLLYENLKNAFTSILDSSEKWDEDALCQADNLLAKLNDFTFMFFINSFDNILSQAGKLFDILQCKLLDIKYGQSKLNYFIHCVEGYREDEHYENILRDTAAVVEQADEFDPPPRKKVRGAQIDYKITYFTIIDNILMSLRERFSGMQEYAFFELLDVNKFEEFANSFPMQHMDCLKNKYPGIFDCKSLVNELKYMYIDSDFKKCKSINTILELLYKLELTSAMPESIKLIKLLLTIPLTSVANERSFSTLDRIRSYLRSTMSQERLSSLARISIEKSILNDLDSKKELHDRIYYKSSPSNQDDWSSCINECALNNQIITATGENPHYIIYGILPCEILIAKPKPVCQGVSPEKLAASIVQTGVVWKPSPRVTRNNRMSLGFRSGGTIKGPWRVSGHSAQMPAVGSDALGANDHCEVKTHWGVPWEFSEDVSLKLLTAVETHLRHPKVPVLHC